MPAKKKQQQAPPETANAKKSASAPATQPHQPSSAAHTTDPTPAATNTAAVATATDAQSQQAASLQEQASSLSVLARKQAALMALLAQFEKTSRNPSSHSKNGTKAESVQRDQITNNLLSAAEALAQMQDASEEGGVSLEVLRKGNTDSSAQKIPVPTDGPEAVRSVDPAIRKKVLRQLLGIDEDDDEGSPDAERIKNEKRLMVRALAAAAAGDDWFTIDDGEDEFDEEDGMNGHGGIYLDEEDDDAGYRGPVTEFDFYAPEGEDDDDDTVDAFNEAVAEKLRKNLGGKINKGFKTVQLDQNGKGRGLVATEDFQSRTIITACRPDIAVLYSSHVKTHCAHCYQPLPTAATAASSSTGGGTTANKPDPRANNGGALTLDAKTTTRGNEGMIGRLGDSSVLQPSFFVCEFCFNFSLCERCNHPQLWDEHHLPCKWFSTLPAEVQENDTDYIRFLLNYCARIQGGDRRLMYAVENLCSNEDAQRENVKKFCASYSKLVASTFAPQGLLISQQHLYSTLLRTKSNAIGFPFDSNATLGWAVQLDICMVNHSCNPNCAITQAANGCIELRALRPIFRDEEITIAYINIPAFPDVRTRIAHLWSEYRFKCACDLCEEQIAKLVACGGTMPKLAP